MDVSKEAPTLGEMDAKVAPTLGASDESKEARAHTALHESNHDTLILGSIREESKEVSTANATDEREEEPLRSGAPAMAKASVLGVYKDVRSKTDSNIDDDAAGMARSQIAKASDLHREKEAAGQAARNAEMQKMINSVQQRTDCDIKDVRLTAGLNALNCKRATPIHTFTPDQTRPASHLYYCRRQRGARESNWQMRPRSARGRSRNDSRGLTRR